VDVRQRTFLLALAGLGFGVLALVGVLLLVLRTSSDAAAPVASGPGREKAEGKLAPAQSEAAPPAPEEPSPQEPAPQEATPKSREGSVAQPLVVHDGAVKRISCETACFIEEQCGFREKGPCRAASCEGDFRKLNHSDFKMGQADECSVLALIPCEEACWRRGECAGDHRGDEQCTAACITLARQLPLETFRESRCVIESACAELPLCGGLEKVRVPDAGSPRATPSEPG
jgi:hypothetical protein